MEQKNNTQNQTFKSYILLTVTFIISIAVGICMIAIDDFKTDISPIIVWAYVAVTIIYAIIAITDLIVNKDSKTKNTKIYIIVMASLNVLGLIFFALAFLLG